MRPLVALLALAVLLAGCAGQVEEPELNATAAENGVNVEFEEGALAEFDAGAVPHLHDYWQGRERVTLFDGLVTPNSTGDAFMATTFTAIFAQEARAGGVPFLLPDGAIVYEGTGQMEITAAPEDATTSSITLSYKSADTTEWTEPIALAAGAPLVIELTPAMTDMPHSPTSRWQFFFQPESPGVMLGAFHLTLDIVKTRDVTEFPGHPDHFHGAMDKLLMSATHRTEKAAYATRGAYLAQNGDFGEPEFPLASIVPMDTTKLRIEVNITGTEATAGEVTEARFFYRGADSSTLQPGGEPIEGTFAEGRLVWEIPVTMEMTDSPYATQSQWYLMVEPATESMEGGPDPTCGGCVDSALEFEVVVIAYRDVVVVEEGAASR